MVPLVRFFQRHFHWYVGGRRLPQVLAQIAEKVFEYMTGPTVVNGRRGLVSSQVGPVEGAARAPSPGLGLGLFQLVGLLPSVAPFVVLPTLVRVRQHAVGLVYFFKCLFSRFVARVHVRMVLSGHAAVGLPHVLFFGILGDPQQFVIISHRSHIHYFFSDYIVANLTSGIKLS